MKRSLRLLLCLLLLGCLLCANAYAQAETAAPEPIQVQCTGILQEGGFPEGEAAAQQPLRAAVQSAHSAAGDVKAAIKQGLASLQETISLAGYQITPGDFNEAYVQTVNENPELFFADGSFQYEQDGAHVRNVFPQYQINAVAVSLTEENKAEIRSRQTALAQAVDAILAQVKADWTPLQKALFLHDYLAVHAQYDTSYQRYDAYSLLVDKTGVCQAYTLAYQLLLNRVGIENGTVSSRTLNHIWNTVLLDDSWYHVDVTWDDPVDDRTGRVLHRYFCISDAKNKTIREGKHYASDLIYEPRISAGSTQYDTYYWEAVDAAFVPIGSSWYYLQDDQLYATDDPKDSGGVHTQLLEKWSVIGEPGYTWNDYFSGLSAYNGKLIYNTADTVYAYDPATRIQEIKHQLPADERGSTQIYGTAVEGNTLFYCVGASPNEPGTVRSVQLDPYTFVPDGGYAYHLEAGKLQLKPAGTQDKRCVFAAWYGVDGRLLGTCALGSAELTISVSGAQTVKIFSVQMPAYTPAREALLLPVN